MKNNLFKNTIYYTLGSLFPQVGAFILLPIYTRYLLPSEFGVINSVQVVSSILAIVYTLAIDKAILRLYFDYKTESERKVYLGTIFISVTLGVVLISTIFFCFPGILNNVYKSIRFYPYMSLGVIASALVTFSVVPRAIFMVEEKARSFISISISEFVLRNLFIVLFVVVQTKGVQGYLQGQVVGSLVLSPILIFVTLKKVSLRFNLKYLLSSLKFSLPILPTLLAAWIMNASDRVFIERYYDQEDVGIYSLGYRIAMFVTIISGAFYKAYNPYYFKIASTIEKAKALKILKNANTVYLIIVLFFGGVVALFSKDLLMIFFEKSYLESYKIIGIVSLALLIGGFGAVFNLAMYQNKKTVFIMYVNLCGAVFNILLNFLLISRYGAYGAAWATVVTYFLVKLIAYFYARKCFYASFHFLPIVSVSLVFLLSNLFFYYMPVSLLYSLIVKSSITLLLMLYLWNRYDKVILKIAKR